MTNSDPAYPASIAPLQATTDATGVAITTLTSSRRINATATVTASSAGAADKSVTVTMRAAEGRRRYGIREFNQGFADDLGWDFNTALLFQRGDQVAGAFFLKFRKGSSTVPEAEQMYFTVGGSPVASIDTNDDSSIGWISQAEMDAAQSNTNLDNSQWLPVNGHLLRISIDRVVLADGSWTIGSDYAYFVNNLGFPTIPALSVDTVSSSLGDAVVRVKAGSLIHRCREIRFKVVDLTQKAPP